MATLLIKDFSCVEEAELELANLTVLIGPQASGKSVISKLVYFFYDILKRQFLALEDEQTFDTFKKSIAEDFKKWFPPSAWGQKQFTITFRAGEYFVQITRPILKKARENENIRINFSPYFETEYRSLLRDLSERISKSKRADKTAVPVADLDLFWKFQSAALKKLESDLGADFVNTQIFVPAGRSFFTSVGKAIAAFEYGGILDPLTLRFGRLFAAIRDRRRSRYPFRQPDKATQDARNVMMRELFSGNIKFDREQEYIEADDGRRIPFGILSSGQQELLPLWLALEYVQEMSGRRSFIYIEEPEAHLFPTWPAAGSADTELGVLMEPEVGHGEAEVYARVQA